MSISLVPSEWLDRNIVIDELRRCYVALSAVLGRLRQHQPTFEDEDVARPQIQLHRSPSRHLLDEDGEGGSKLDLGALHADPLSPVGSPEPANDALRAVTNLADAVDPLTFGNKGSMTMVVEFLRSTCRFLSGYDPKRRNHSSRNPSVHGSQAEGRTETQSEARHRGAAWYVFAQIVESLVVYFNKHPPLLTELMGKSDNLLLLLKVLERGSFLSAPDPHEVAAFPMRRSTSEMEELEASLLESHVPEELAGKIVNAYGQELLVDGALPPAVCSGRHEAAVEAANRQRGLLCTQILAPRFSVFISALVQNSDYERIAFLLNLSVTAPFKVRQKMCDRLAAEGLLQKVADEVFPRRSTHRKLIPDDHQMARVLDILCSFSRPADDDDVATVTSATPQSGSAAGNGSNNSATASPKRRRKPPNWMSDPHLHRIFQGCFDVLAEVPAHVHGGEAGVHIAKITAFLTDCAQTDARPLVLRLAELTDAALDHFYSRCVHRLLPLVLAVVRSPLVRKPQEEELPAIIGCWFGTILIHANYSNSKHRATDRQYLLRVEPFLRFAAALAESREAYASGAKSFVEKTRAAAAYIMDHASERLAMNMLLSVVCHTRTVLAKVDFATDTRWTASAAPEGATRRSARAASTVKEEGGTSPSSRKRSRSPSTVGGCAEPVFPSEPVSDVPDAAAGVTPPTSGPDESQEPRRHHHHHRHKHHHRHDGGSDRSSDTETEGGETETLGGLPNSPIQRSVSPLSGHSPADPTYAADGSPIVSTTTAKGVGELTWKALRLFTQPLTFASGNRGAS